MNSADALSWAVMTAAVPCFKSDLKYCSHSGGSGPLSSWLSLKRVMALGNGALLKCQIHRTLAFPEHVR